MAKNSAYQSPFNLFDNPFMYNPNYGAYRRADVFMLDSKKVLKFTIPVVSSVYFSRFVYINFVSFAYCTNGDAAQFDINAIDFNIDDFYVHTDSSCITFISKYWYNECKLTLIDTRVQLSPTIQVNKPEDLGYFELRFYNQIGYRDIISSYTRRRTVEEFKDARRAIKATNDVDNNKEEYSPSNEELEKAKYETNNDIKNDDPCPNGPEGYSAYYSTPTSEERTLLRSDKLKEIVDKDVDNLDKTIEKATDCLLSSIRIKYEALNREINEVISKKTEIILKDLSNFYKDLKEDISTNKDHILMNRELIIDIAKTVNHTNVYVQGETPWNRKLDDKVIDKVEEISSAIENVKDTIAKSNSNSANIGSIAKTLSNIESELTTIKKYTHDTVCRVNTKL